MSDESWDDEVDLLVLGTGAGGLAAAVTGADQGLSTLVLEKTEYLGGTTAYSAGTCWIPGNRFLDDDNDVEEASRYLDALVGDRAPRELREAYLARGGEMVEYLDRIGVGFWHSKTVVDYHPEIPGSARGRALEPQTFDGRVLGKADFGRVRRPVPEFALFGGTLMVRRAEVNDLLGIYAGSVRGVLTALRLGVRWAADRLRYPRGTRLAMGNALVANLFDTLLAHEGRVWFTATATELIREEGRVVGAVVAHQGRELRVRARRGVVLAGGGFSASAASCPPRLRSSPARPRARRGRRSSSRRPSAPRWGSPATTTRSGSPVPSAAAATAPRPSSRTSGTGPSRGSSRWTGTAAGSSTSRCPTTGSSAPCTPRRRCRRGS
jgi:3-oxosteroid 1-dehydrogenase